MKIRLIALIILGFTLSILTPSAMAGESTRKERRLITKGNKLYRDRKFVESMSVYEEALRENANSAEARYNLGLSQMRQVTNPTDTTGKNMQLMNQARQNFSNVASLAKTKPSLAAKANFNLGNIEFNAKDYQKAVEYYKQSLRIDPNDDKARKNLRIAQKNLQQQNQDKNQNQDQNQDKDQNQNKEQNQDQQQNQQQQNEDRQQQNQPKEQNQLSQQAASQILQAVDNKENQTRARVNKANKGEKSVGSGHSTRRW